MNERHVEVLRKLLTNLEKGPATPEVKEKVRAALEAAIEALEQKDRDEKPTDEVGLSANEFLFNLSMGVREDEDRRADAVNHLAGLVNSELREQPAASGAVGQLADLVRRNEG